MAGNGDERGRTPRSQPRHTHAQEPPRGIASTPPQGPMVYYSRRPLPAERGPRRTAPSTLTPKPPHIPYSGTMWACGNGGPPPLPVSPRLARRPAGHARWQLAGSRPSEAHFRTGGEEECARTGDTNPGCNYLVRGYSPSMHFFRRGNRPHFSPPLPFRRGCAGRPCRRAAAVPRPPRRARRRPRPARAGRPRVPGRGCLPAPTAGTTSTSAGPPCVLARGRAPATAGGQAPRSQRRARCRGWLQRTLEREGRRNAPEPGIPIQAVII